MQYSDHSSKEVRILGNEYMEELNKLCYTIFKLIIYLIKNFTANN